MILLWVGFRFAMAEREAREALPPRSSNATDSKSKLPSPVVETPRIERTLLDAGVERDRLRWENGYLVVETFDPPDIVAEKVRSGMPGSVVTREGELIVVSHGEVVDRVRVAQLHRDTEGDGFVPVPSEKPVPSDAATVPRNGKIVLVLDDVGYENQPLEDVASIDARISFAVIPGSPNATESAKFLASQGYEILCHLPMEPLDYPNVSPGDNAIFIAMSDEAIREVATSNIASIPFVKGVNNHMGSRATRDPRVMRSVSDVLLQSGLYFIDSRTAGSSVAAKITRDARIPTGVRDVFLDDDPSEPAVRKQLRQLVRLSERREFVIGIGHVYPTTVRVLREEIPRLEAAGYEFLFASDVLR